MHPFDRDTALGFRNSKRFNAEVSGDWSINGVANGGYLLALLTKAMLQGSDKQATPILTANYMARSLAGPAQLTAEKFAASTQFTRIQASLYQEGGERVRALGTFGIWHHPCAVQCHECSAPHLPPPEACTIVSPMEIYTLYNQLDVRLDPSCAGWMEGQLTDRSEQRGWATFKDPRPWDVPAIALIADAFPPAVFASQGMVAWVPTIELSVNVRSLPVSNWIKARFQTRFVTCGLLEEDGELWDAADNLVAVSRQIAQFRVKGA
jgi:hypothetical protein